MSATAINNITLNSAPALGDRYLMVDDPSGSPSAALAEVKAVFKLISNSPKLFDAVGDDSTNDTSALSSCFSASGSNAIHIPSGVFKATTLAATSITNRLYGQGQVRTSDGYKRGSYFINISSAPATLGNHDSVVTAFDGDVSKCQFPIEHRITGAASLGQPTTGYTYTPELAAVYGVLYNSSGYNHSTSSNDGRTSATFNRIRLHQYGQGDCVAYNASAFVSGAKAGATSFLANPAASIVNGDMTAGAAGVYLNPSEIYLTDAGYDVAAVGDVINLNRTNKTGALGVIWAGHLIQSKGTQEIDVCYAASGKADKGLDFVPLTLSTAKAAINLAANQKIYGNGTNSDTTKYSRYTSVGDDWITYNGTEWEIATNNAKVLAVGDEYASSAKPFGLMSSNVASLPSASSHTGRIVYCTNGNAGSPCIAVSNGTNWLRIALGSTVSAT